jgi:hypothetical protein
MNTLQFRRIAVPKTAVLIPASAPAPTPAPVPAPAPIPVDDDAVDAIIETDPSIPKGAAYPKLTPTFLLAGRAVFTVSNPKGDHYTFRIKKTESEWPKGSGKMQTTYFVTVKAPGGKYPYAYIGMLNTTTGGIKCTAQSIYTPGSREYDVAVWACQAVIQMKFIPEGYKIEHAGKCGKCGRELTDPLSIERGIGPDCWETL